MSRSFLSNLLLWQQTGFEVFEVSAVVFHILHCVMNSFPFISVQPWPEAYTFVTAARQPLWNTSIKITKRIKNTEKTVQQVVVCANASYKTSGCGCACTWLHSPKGSKPAWTCMRKHLNWCTGRLASLGLLCTILLMQGTPTETRSLSSQTRDFHWSLCVSYHFLPHLHSAFHQSSTGVGIPVVAVYCLSHLIF